MKRLYKFIFCFCAWAFVSVPVFALNVTGADVKLMNDISKYIDEKPDVQAVNFCEHALQSNSIPLKSLASVILFKHFGDKYKSDFRKNFTIKKEIGNFEQDKQIFVGINNVGRLLEPLNAPLQQFTDERVRSLFLFLHFRHKNVYMLGNSREELPLASFYRTSFINTLFQWQTDVNSLIQTCDQ